MSLFLGPSTDESGEEEECGDRDTAAEDPIEPTAKGALSVSLLNA